MMSASVPKGFLPPVKAYFMPESNPLFHTIIIIIFYAIFLLLRTVRKDVLKIVPFARKIRSSGTCMVYLHVFY